MDRRPIAEFKAGTINFLADRVIEADQVTLSKMLDALEAYLGHKVCLKMAQEIEEGVNVFLESAHENGLCRTVRHICVEFSAANSCIVIEPLAAGLGSCRCNQQSREDMLKELEG